ncbi:hypothetical protein GMMP1_1580001 [Candidatus Magnetomoraceae bacterium gMMP-1]
MYINNSPLLTTTGVTDQHITEQ